MYSTGVNFGAFGGAKPSPRLFLSSSSLSEILSQSISFPPFLLLFLFALQL